MSLITHTDVARILTLQYLVENTSMDVHDELQWAVTRMCQALRRGERFSLRALSTLRHLADSGKFYLTVPTAYIDECIMQASVH